MNAKFELPDGKLTGTTQADKTVPTTRRLSGQPIEGKITETIGGGEHAKNSFVWVTIRSCFFIGAATSVAIYLRPVYCQAEIQGNLVDDIKSAWSIFLPVITLALGYAFGKGK